MVLGPSKRTVESDEVAVRVRGSTSLIALSRARCTTCYSLCVPSRYHLPAPSAPPLPAAQEAASLSFLALSSLGPPSLAAAAAAAAAQEAAVALLQHRPAVLEASKVHAADASALGVALEVWGGHQDSSPCLSPFRDQDSDLLSILQIWTLFRYRFLIQSRLAFPRPPMIRSRGWCRRWRSGTRAQSGGASPSVPPPPSPIRPLPLPPPRRGWPAGRRRQRDPETCPWRWPSSCSRASRRPGGGGRSAAGLIRLHFSLNRTISLDRPPLLITNVVILSSPSRLYNSPVPSGWSSGFTHNRPPPF